MKKIVIAAAAAATAVLAVLGVNVASAGVWTPGGVTVTVPVPPAALACQQGSITYNISQYAPATISSLWTSNGCSQLQSPELKDDGGGIHYGDSWRSAVGTHSTATSPDAMDQGKAWLRYKNGPGDQIFCFRVWPTRGTAWFPANGTICG